MAPGQGSIGHVAGSIQGFIQVGSFFALKFKLALESPSYPFNFSQPWIIELVYLFQNLYVI